MGSVSCLYVTAWGIWQFIPETGKRYGLQQYLWYVGRRVVLAGPGAGSGPDRSAGGRDPPGIDRHRRRVAVVC